MKKLKAILSIILITALLISTASASWQGSSTPSSDQWGVNSYTVDELHEEGYTYVEQMFSDSSALREAILDTKNYQYFISVNPVVLTVKNVEQRHITRIYIDTLTENEFEAYYLPEDFEGSPHAEIANLNQISYYKNDARYVQSRNVGALTPEMVPAGWIIPAAALATIVWIICDGLVAVLAEYADDYADRKNYKYFRAFLKVGDLYLSAGISENQAANYLTDYIKVFTFSYTLAKKVCDEATDYGYSTITGTHACNDGLSGYRHIHPAKDKFGSLEPQPGGACYY